MRSIPQIEVARRVGILASGLRRDRARRLRAPGVGVTLRLAADLYGLGFQPWREERYDLVIPEAEFDAPPVRRLMDALNSGMLARAISRLCAYDTAQMGRVETPLA